MVVAGVLFVAGGMNHPPGDPTAGFDAHFVAMLSDPSWPLSHWLTLAGAVFLVIAFVLARRDDAFRRRAGRAMTWAVVGSALWSVEAFFHLIADMDVAALSAGGATPILDTHLMLSVVAYPVLCWSSAVVAGRVGWRWVMLARPLAVVGILGGLVYGAAPPIAVLTRDSGWSFLFPLGAIPFSIWLVSLGAIGTGAAAD